MNESQLRDLLSSISHLAEYGEIPVHAFGTLMASAQSESVAELLHQRWLSDPRFAKIAAELVLHLHNTAETRDMTICTQVLSMALRDYKMRRKIRKKSRNVYRNYVGALLALYPAYRQIDKSLSACLVDPLLRSLHLLTDDQPDDSDLRCVSDILTTNGPLLNLLNAEECDRIVVRCRKWLVSNEISLGEETKLRMIHAIDLWTYSWDLQLFPDALRRFYNEEFAIYGRKSGESGNEHSRGTSTAETPEVSYHEYNENLCDDDGDREREESIV